MAESSALARYLAEFIGTYVLVFTVGCNVITGQTVWGGVSIACVLTVMVYALGSSSGANFNPAVSFALGLCRKMPWPEVASYVMVQFVAGICAAFSYVGMFGIQHAFNLVPGPGHSFGQALFVESVYTCMLCFVVLNVAASKVHGGCNQFYGIAIGFVIVAGSAGGGSVSMGCYNPAVAMALDLASFQRGVKWGFIYPFAEFFGAALACMFFHMCRPEERSEQRLDTDAEGKPVPPEYRKSSKLVSEFLGTYMLVLTVGLNVLSNSEAGAFSSAAALTSMIYAVGSCSGAHFNPAVTFAIVCRGAISCTEALHYVGTQITAGIMGAFTFYLLMDNKTFQLKPDTYRWDKVLGVEFVFTFLLCFVVLSVATVKKPLSEYFGFAIGMCVSVGGIAVGTVSRAALNPAVSIGISSAYIPNGGVFWPCLVYSSIELLAALAAAMAFRLTQPSEHLDDEEAKPLTVANGDKASGYLKDVEAPAESK